MGYWDQFLLLIKPCMYQFLSTTMSFSVVDMQLINNK